MEISRLYSNYSGGISDDKSLYTYSPEQTVEALQQLAKLKEVHQKQYTTVFKPAIKKWLETPIEFRESRFLRKDKRVVSTPKNYFSTDKLGDSAIRWRCIMPTFVDMWVGEFANGIPIQSWDSLPKGYKHPNFPNLELGGFSAYEFVKVYSAVLPIHAKLEILLEPSYCPIQLTAYNHFSLLAIPKIIDIISDEEFTNFLFKGVNSEGFYKFEDYTSSF